MTKIEISRNGRVYIPIYIKPQYDITMAMVNFKFDTGSDYTTISKKNLIAIGYDMEWINQNVIVLKNDITTATGDVVNAGYIQLPLINILEYECIKWPFHIIIDESKDFRNLIGLDLLTYFDCHIIYSKNIFTADMVKNPIHRFRFLPGQEIHELSL